MEIIRLSGPYFLLMVDILWFRIYTVKRVKIDHINCVILTLFLFVRGRLRCAGESCHCFEIFGSESSSRGWVEGRVCIDTVCLAAEQSCMLRLPTVAIT